MLNLSPSSKIKVIRKTKLYKKFWCELFLLISKDDSKFGLHILLLLLFYGCDRYIYSFVKLWTRRPSLWHPKSPLLNMSLHKKFTWYENNPLNISVTAINKIIQVWCDASLMGYECDDAVIQWNCNHPKYFYPFWLTFHLYCFWNSQVSFPMVTFLKPRHFQFSTMLCLLLP